VRVNQGDALDALLAALPALPQIPTREWMHLRWEPGASVVLWSWHVLSPSLHFSARVPRTTSLLETASQGVTTAVPGSWNVAIAAC